MGTISANVVIIGGGIIGCATAYYLRKAGVDVILLERGEPGEQASGAAAGLLAPLGPLAGPGPFADLLLAGFRLFPALLPELQEASGQAFSYRQSGALRVIRNPRRVPHLRKRLAAWQPLGLRLHWLDGDEARALEPTLAPEVCAAIYAPEEAQIDAQALLRGFAQAALSLGARFYTQCTITELEIGQGRVRAIHTALGERIVCERLILATGAWQEVCQEWLGIALPVRPLAGQLLALTQTTPALQHIVFGDAAYIVPRGNSVIVGATREETGFVARVTEEGVAGLMTTAQRLVPALTASHFEKAWAGLRPHTPDHRPILGPLPGWENVLVALGHNSVGVLLSGITGQLICEMLVEGRVPELAQSFLAERFLGDFKIVR